MYIVYNNKKILELAKNEFKVRKQHRGGINNRWRRQAHNINDHCAEDEKRRGLPQTASFDEAKDSCSCLFD